MYIHTNIHTYMYMNTHTNTYTYMYMLWGVWVYGVYFYRAYTIDRGIWMYFYRAYTIDRGMWMYFYRSYTRHMDVRHMDVLV